MRTKTEIISSMNEERGKIQLSLLELSKDVHDLAAMVPDDPERPPVEPEKPERPPIEPPPVTGPEDRIPGKLTGDMSPVDVATAISEARPGTTFYCNGEIPLIRIGGVLGDYGPGSAMFKNVAHHPDGSPIRDIRFERGPTIHDEGWKNPEIHGVLLHNSLGGFDDVRINGVNVRPRQDGDRAAILCEEHFDPNKFQGGLFVLANSYIYAPDDWDAFDGYGYKQSVVMRSSRFLYENNTYSPPKEHGTGYSHNIRGDSIGRNLEVVTRFINGVEVGCGRTIHQVQERRSDGLESFGNILFENVRGSLCGSEGVLAGNKASGGSAFTTGGHQGTITWKNCHVDEPMTGGVVAVWEETENDGTPKGFGYPAVEKVVLEGITWTPSTHPLASSRRPIQVDSVKELVASGVQDITNPWLDDRVKLGPTIGSIDWT